MHTYGVANVLTAQLDAKNALHFAENLGMRNGLATLILLDDGGLFVNAHSQVLLCHGLGLARLSNNLADGGRHPRRRRNIIRAIQLGNALVIGALMTLIMACGN